MSDVITAGDIQWPIQPPCGDTGPGDVSPDVWAAAQAVAIDWVWALSGRKFGQYDVVFRPEWTVPPRRDNRHYVLGSGYRPGFSQVPNFDPAHPLLKAPLPGPVASITSVEVDGATLATSAYELNGDELLRVDGGQWYRFQNTTLPVTAAGTWQISYLRGLPVPAGGQVAAGVLACEEAKYLTGDKTCRLANNTTNVSRNGVTVNLDALQLQKGFTGIREVDQWCRQVNPNGRQEAPFVWSPDLDPNMQPPIPATT